MSGPGGPLLPSRPGRRLRRLRRRARQARFHSELRRSGVVLGTGSHVAIGSDVSPRTTIGRGTRVNGPGVFKGGAPIRLGNYCAVGAGVRFISSNHRMDLANLQRQLHRDIGLGEMEETGGPIEIGHNVWIGDAAIALEGVAVGNGAAIGAGAVLTRNIPAFAIAVGCPARVLRYRFEPDVIEELQELAWWEWSEGRLRENRDILSLEPGSPEFRHRVRGELAGRAGSSALRSSLS